MKIIFIELFIFCVLFLIRLFSAKLSLESRPIKENKYRSEAQSIFCNIYLWFAISVAISAILFGLISLNNPQGYWDAWTIWNMRARFLVRSGEQIGIAFSSLLAHSDYPLLLPCNVARIWTLLGNESLFVPIFTAFSFTIATIGLLFSSLSYMQNRYQGLLAVLFLLTIGSFMERGADQMADIPIGLYYLSTIICYSIYHFENEKSFYYIFLAGIMAGFAAWTKNEGILFFIVVILARFLLGFSSSGFHGYLREITIFCCGAAPIILLVSFFKLKFAPLNYIILGQGVEITLSRLFDGSRYLLIGKSFIFELIDLFDDHWILIALVIIFWGFSTNKQNKLGIQNTWYTLSLMLIGYFMVYIITPEEVIWHLRTSLSRLLMQLLPSAIFLFFMSMANHDEVRARKIPIFKLWPKHIGE